MTIKHDAISYPPRGLSREEAARYVGVSPALFDEMVNDGRMPQPREINARRVWDRAELDIHFTTLPKRDERWREALAEYGKK
jgi:predicted DNA-binding transcriptional regulator AlpA